MKTKKAPPARGKAAAPHAARVAKDPILGEHPSPPHPFGEALSATDGKTETKVTHRALIEKDGGRATTVAAVREMLIRHHASTEALERDRRLREAMIKLGFEAEQARLRRFPMNDTTRKGNLAEVVLAEYVVAANRLALPIYRLRYNPNVDQSMKGDDVLAFDLDADPVRVVVGEAKFRAASSTAAVEEIVAGLMRSHRGGVPISLQFVADRLFEAGQVELGTKVLACAQLFALGKLRLDYVGMLLSDPQSAERVNRATPASLRRLAMISLGVPDPDSLVEASYNGLE